MTISHTMDGIISIFELNGDLNALTAPHLRTTLSEAIATGSRKLVVDLSDVSFIDSSGLSALISGLKASNIEGGKLVLAGLQEQARAIFEITMAYRLFDLAATVVEAKALLAS